MELSMIVDLILLAVSALFISTAVRYILTLFKKAKKGKEKGDGQKKRNIEIDPIEVISA